MHSLDFLYDLIGQYGLYAVFLLAMIEGDITLLLAGVLIHYRQTGSLAFGTIGLTSPGAALILLAFGIKCAFPLLHNWLQDAYPEATVTGTVLLSSFTTKVAVYALARGFAGTEILVPIGAAMTAFPIFYAVIENDLRRVLAYSLNNQLGFMVVDCQVYTPHLASLGAREIPRAEFIRRLTQLVAEDAETGAWPAQGACYDWQNR